MVGFVSVQDVSTFPHFQVHTNTRISLESSPTGGVCPGLGSLMIEDIINRPHDLSQPGCCVHMVNIINN